MRKHIAATLVISSIALVGAVGVHTALAQEPTGHLNIVQKIAERFNLNESDVQQVFDQAHQERHQEMTVRFEDRLSTLVSEGKLTEDQKSLILQKFSEFHGEKSDFEGKSPEEIHAAMKEKHDELKQWAEDNGIDLSLIMPFGGGPRFFNHAL